MKSILLILVFCLFAHCALSEEVFKPVFLGGIVKGENVMFMIQPEGSFPKIRKLKGATLINIEPGCILVETYCKYLDEKRLQIELPSDGFFTDQTKKLLGIEENVFVVEFKPEMAPNRASKILSITPIKDSESDVR